MIRSINAYVYFFIWAVILFSISLADWYDHITREHQVFSVYPEKWLLFTFMNTVLLLTVAIGCFLLLSQFIRIRFVAELLSFLSGMMSFLLLGNYIRQYTIPEITLHFPFNLSAIAIALVVFSMIWIIINILFRVKFKSALRDGD